MVRVGVKLRKSQMDEELKVLYNCSVINSQKWISWD